jgi:alpha-beta hydrolase superfamily lysophospholipase
MTDQLTDVLGADYRSRTITLRPDRFGAAVATLVHRPAPENTRGAILLLHGFADYFFHTELADDLTARGFDCYALDLRGYGRSLRPHQLPNFVTDLSVYFEELDEAVKLIRADGHERVVLAGHSTGGLVAPLWLHARRSAPPVDALVLNSPWLELAEPPVMKLVARLVTSTVGAIAPTMAIRSGLGTFYGRSIHRDHDGEWDYNLEWKPLRAFPVRAGWLRAIRRGHRAVHRGLDVPVPVLLMHSSRSLLHVPTWTEDVHKADLVLDVADMVRWGPKLGRDVTLAEIPDGLHDLFLSAKPVRDRAITEMDDWLGSRVTVGP